jgi:hypothetical protein
MGTFYTLTLFYTKIGTADSLRQFARDWNEQRQLHTIYRITRNDIRVISKQTTKAIKTYN